MIRTLRMFSPLLLRPIVLLSIAFLTFIAVTGYGMKVEENIWSVALGVPLIAGVWMRAIREEALSFRVLWVAPEYRERLFQLEIAIVTAVTVLVGAFLFAEQGLLFAVEAVALVLLVFVLVDGEHWRDRMTWPANALRIAVVAGLVKPEWARAALESRPLLITVAMLAAVVVLRSENRLTVLARRITNNPSTGLFDPPDVDIEGSSRAAPALSHQTSISDAERPSLWAASDRAWRRASYYEHGNSLAGILLLLLLFFIWMFIGESQFVMYAYVLLGLGSLRLRLQTLYPLSRRRRRNIHFALSQFSLAIGVVVLAAGALLAGAIESLWGGSGMSILGWDGVLVQSALIIGAAPLVQFPRKRHARDGIGFWMPLMWSLVAALLLHFAFLASFAFLLWLTGGWERLAHPPGLEILWYAIAFAIIGQIANWKRLGRHFAHGDLI